MADQKTENFNVVGYLKGQKKIVGYAYKTKQGNWCVKADEMQDPAKLGRLLKKGLYIESRNKKASPKKEYQCAADEYDKKFNEKAA